MVYAILPYLGGFLAFIIVGGFVYFIGKGKTKREAFKDASDQVRQYFPKKKEE